MFCVRHGIMCKVIERKIGDRKIKVDGLEPTKEFKEYIEKEKRGEVTMTDIKQYLDKKYKVKDT